MAEPYSKTWGQQNGASDLNRKWTDQQMKWRFVS